MDERQKVTNYRMIGHHERLCMLKVQILLFFPTFGCFCLLVVYMFLMVWYYGSDTTNLGLMIERVPCWSCNCLLIEMCITVCGDGWWEVLHL